MHDIVQVSQWISVCMMKSKHASPEFKNITTQVMNLKTKIHPIITQAIHRNFES